MGIKRIMVGLLVSIAWSSSAPANDADHAGKSHKTETLNSSNWATTIISHKDRAVISDAPTILHGYCVTKAYIYNNNSDLGDVQTASNMVFTVAAKATQDQQGLLSCNPEAFPSSYFILRSTIDIEETFQIMSELEAQKQCLFREDSKGSCYMTKIINDSDKMAWRTHQRLAEIGRDIRGFLYCAQDELFILHDCIGVDIKLDKEGKITSLTTSPLMD